MNCRDSQTDPFFLLPSRTGLDCSIHRASPDTSERTSGAKVKTVMITDPDGNHVAFAQAIGQGMAR
jgi:hypothetical protein